MNSTRVARGPSSKRRTKRKKRVQRSNRRVSKRVRRTKYRRRRQKAGMRRTLRGLLPTRRRGPQQDPLPGQQQESTLSPVHPVHGDEDERKNYGKTLVKVLAEMPTDIQGKVEEDVSKIRNMERENITLTTLGPFEGNWYKRIKESDPENYYYEFVIDMDSDFTKRLLQYVTDIWPILDKHRPYRRYLYDMEGVPEVQVSDDDWPGDHYFEEYVLNNRPTTD